MCGTVSRQNIVSCMNMSLAIAVSATEPRHIKQSLLLHDVIDFTAWH